MNYDKPTAFHPGSEDPTIPSGGNGSETKTPAPISRPKRIGPYTILETLGEGGMGVVYLAEQTEPVRRRVALKIIKPGMDSSQVLARFESERQAMAMMNHVFVAKVFDADITEDGRPYFVMEHVPGVSITEYCDTHHLDLEDRMQLFIQVCEAIQHAHQNGIIHRDIKPSNILVSIEGDHPVPKVIDFGVAKAVHHQISERTLFTEQGQLIGTPEYMSPEQAEMTGLNVDTRTDIYALGVLLYELLSGSLPFESSELRRAAFDEIRRRIREDDPPKPSTKLSDLGEKDSLVISQQRHSSRAAMVKEMRGDLDWITMKALDKDRTRRYASAAELAADILRHLHHEPVLAGPPSAVYRAGKFVRRHRALVTGAAAVLVVLVGGVVSTTVFAVGESRALKKEETARARADRMFQRGHRLAKTFMGEFHDAIVELPGTLPARQLLVEEAMSYLEDIEKDAADDEELTIDLASGHRRIGQMMGGLRGPNLNRSDEATEHYQTAVRLHEQVMEQDPHLRENLLGLARSHYGVADIYRKQSRWDDARSEYEQARALCADLLEADDGDDSALRLSSSTELQLGDCLVKTNDYEGAQDYYERSRIIREQRAQGYSEGTPDYDRAQRDLSVIHTRLAMLLDHSGDLAGARQHYEKSLEIRRTQARKNPDSTRRQRDVMNTLTYLGEVAEKAEDIESVRRNLDEALAFARHLTAVDPLDQRARIDLANLLHSYGDLLVRAGHPSDGLPLLENALSNYQSLATDFPGTTTFRQKVDQLQQVLAGLNAPTGN